eukprot:9468709-Pyramimonas_sp.AAC.1
MEHGCFNLRKNICRAHSLTMDQSNSLDVATGLLNQWVDHIGKAAATSVSEVLHIVCSDNGDPDAPPELHCFVLLAVPVYKPKMQFLVPCVIATGDSHTFVGTEVPEIPFRLHLRLNRHRLVGDSMQVLDIITSDE